MTVKLPPPLALSPCWVGGAKNVKSYMSPAHDGATEHMVIIPATNNVFILHTETSPFFACTPAPF
jgi:hypothetical protein